MAFITALPLLPLARHHTSSSINRSTICATAAPSQPQSQFPRTQLITDAFAPGVSTLQNEGAYAVMEAARELEQRTGKSVIHLEIGQPGFDTPEHISSAGISAIQRGRTRYSSPAGIPDLRSAIASWARDNRSLSYVTPEHIIIGPGAKPGLFFTTLALIRGIHDRVVIPDPGFPTYDAMVAVAGGTAVPVRLRDDMQSFDMNSLREVIDERTRLVVLNSPGNPTGGVMPLEDMLEIVRLANLYDFYVLSDEIYSQLLYEGNYTSIASLPGMQDRTIVVDGFSKSFCMTGWRLGWAIMPVQLARKVELLMVHSVGCTATFVQEAGIAAIEGVNDGGVDAMKEQFRKRRDVVVDGLNGMEGVSCASPLGAFYAWADVRSIGKSSKEIADFLLQDGYVAVLPGTDFGEGGEGFIRLSYVSEEDVLQEGLKRIENSLIKLSSAEA